MLRNLGYIAARSKEVVKALPKQVGASRPVVRPQGFSAKEDCALYIIEALKLKTGKAPGINNDKAWGIMEAFWQVATSEKMTESSAGWARYITRVNAKSGKAVELYREKVRGLIKMGMDIKGE